MLGRVGEKLAKQLVDLLTILMIELKPLPKFVNNHACRKVDLVSVFGKLEVLTTQVVNAPSDLIEVLLKEGRRTSMRFEVRFAYDGEEVFRQFAR